MEDGPSPHPYYRILSKSYICFCILFLVLRGYEQQKNNIGNYNEVKREQQYSRLGIYKMPVTIKSRNGASRDLHVLAGFIKLPILLRATWLIGCSRLLWNRAGMKLCLILQNSNAPPSRMRL